jgi:tetratricopeptide (TPR) repeat protein
MEPHLQRAEILIQRSRFAEAERELMQTLVVEPENPYAHAYLALCQLNRHRDQEALRFATKAVGLAPDDDYCHSMLARVYLAQDRLDVALRSIREAIRIEPEDANHHTMESAIHISRKHWARALSAAERGLSLDPENTECANFRVMALRQLGRDDEAGDALESALSRSPDNAMVHANRGWQFLKAVDQENAFASFREALRLDPQLDWARQGVVEALKARSFIYRIMLQYFFWMSRLSPRARWGVIIGGYIGYRFMLTTARKNPEVAPYLWPIMGVYIAFVLLTWISDPLFDLMLRMNRFGRLAMTDEQILASNVFGACLLLALVTALGGLLAGNNALLFSAAGIGALIIPISGSFRRGLPRFSNKLWLLTALLTLLALAGAVAALVEPAEPPTLTIIALIGCMLFTWIANIIGT